MKPSASNKRRSTRRPASGPLDWSTRGGGEKRPGWILERSDDGLAFALRAPVKPQRAALLELRRGDAAPGREPELGVIRHVAAAHGDLFVVGVELLRMRPFPPAVSAAAAVESKPTTAISGAPLQAAA
jgi:hypothetical protein